MNSDNQPPWGRNKGPKSPEEVLAAVLKKIKDFFEGGGGGKGSDDSGGGSSRKPPDMRRGIIRILIVIGVLFVANVVYSSFYTIQPGEKGVVLRLGKYYKLASSGLNFKVPLMDDLVKVDVESVRKQEFGFRTRSPGKQTIFDKSGYDEESLMLSGDKNVINCEWIVQYKIKDPFKFVFKVRNVDESVRDISETAIRRYVGNRNFDYVLHNRGIMEEATQQMIQETLNGYESGVDIIAVKLQDINPPDPVKPAFNEVNKADQEMKQMINVAQREYNKIIPKARGQAKQKIQEAVGYGMERINLAQGEADRFLSLLSEYEEAKEVTRKRLYLETMQKVLPALADIYVIDKDSRSILPLLDLTGKKGITGNNR